MKKEKEVNRWKEKEGRVWGGVEEKGRMQGKGKGDFVDEKDYEFSPTNIIFINSSFKSAQGKNIY